MKSTEVDGASFPLPSYIYSALGPDLRLAIRIWPQ
jgi:hypothetical protein